MRAIKLMADYGCSPLWEASPGVVGNIDLNDLPISGMLKERLLAWALEYDLTLNGDDPLSSSFPSEKSATAFEHMGHELATALQTELGPDYHIAIDI